MTAAHDVCSRAPRCSASCSRGSTSASRPTVRRSTPTTPLFAGGLIDSLRILELIAWTERAIGREIADGEIRTDNFASAARIVDTLRDGGADAHR